jgi:uncharacterized protein DUF6134
MRPTSLVFAALSTLAVGASAQSAVMDEGTLMVTRNGAPLGRESFRLVRAPAPGGQVYRATGQSALGDSRTTTSLSTDSSGVPVSYESEVTRQGRKSRLRGAGRPGRFSVLVGTATAESTREYVLNNGALVIDQDVFHHYMFVPLAMGHANVVVIVPQSAEQETLKLEERGSEMVEVANRSIRSRHFALVAEDGSTRDVWVDDKGRLLKVSIPARGLVALRDDPPR